MKILILFLQVKMRISMQSVIFDQTPFCVGHAPLQVESYFIQSLKMMPLRQTLKDCKRYFKYLTGHAKMVMPDSQRFSLNHQLGDIVVFLHTYRETTIEINNQVLKLKTWISYSYLGRRSFKSTVVNQTSQSLPGGHMHLRQKSR